MDVRFLEVTNGPQNWGKFMVAKFTEWDVPSALDGRPLLAGRGWTPNHLLVVDLQTGEGAIFHPGGLATADLNKHAVWVCPMFPFALQEIYERGVDDLPAIIDLPDAPFEWAGYRRRGALVAAARAVDEAWDKFIERDFDSIDDVAETIGQLRQALADLDG
jgi:hypothetical protein